MRTFVLGGIPLGTFDNVAVGDRVCAVIREWRGSNTQYRRVTGTVTFSQHSSPRTDGDTFGGVLTIRPDGRRRDIDLFTHSVVEIQLLHPAVDDDAAWRRWGVSNLEGK